MKLLYSVLNEGNLPYEILRRLYASMRQLENEIRELASQMVGPNNNHPYDPFHMLQHRRVDRAVNEEDERLLRAITVQAAYLHDIISNPEVRGPLTADNEIRRRIRLVTERDQDRDLANLAEREEAERKRQERRDLQEQYRMWLAALEQMNPREAALSRLIAEANDLIKLGIADVRPNVKLQMTRTLKRIDKERRARHTFASHSTLMGRLEGELANDVRFIKTVMGDEAVTVHDLFGSEGEDEE